MALAHGRASSQVSRLIGPAPPGWWQPAQLRWTIAATSPDQVGGGASLCAAAVGAAASGDRQGDRRDSPNARPAWSALCYLPVGAAAGFASVNRHRCERVRMKRLPRAIAGLDIAVSSSELVPTTSNPFAESST